MNNRPLHRYQPNAQTEPPIDQVAAIRAFVRIVETGSFTQAARSLETPKPTVTKLVQQLEAHLHAKLLSRSTRRLAVTSDGAAYYERAVRILADLEELDASVAASQARPRGRLRIDLSAVLAQRIILPALDGFFERYPDIQLDIGTSERPIDLMAENVDCVIRAGAVGDLSLIARRIGDMHMATLAAPAYLDRHGMPEHPTALESGHHVVAFIGARTGRPFPFEFVRGTETLQVAGPYRTAFNDAATYVLAGVMGHGILQAPYIMAQPHCEAGTLRPVLPEWTVPPIPLHVVYPPNRHLGAKLRIFVDWAAGLFATAPLGPDRAAIEPQPSVSRAS